MLVSRSLSSFEVFKFYAVQGTLYVLEAILFPEAISQSRLVGISFVKVYVDNTSGVEKGTFENILRLRVFCNCGVSDSNHSCCCVECTPVDNSWITTLGL